MIARACEQCGNDFQVKYPSDPKRFCNRACKANASKGEQRPWLWKRGTFQCVVCGAEFERGGRYQAGQTRKPKGQAVCSEECARRARYRHGRISSQLTPEQAAYIAGFVDADGSFIIHGRYDGTDSLSFRVQAGGTKPAVFEWFKEITGIGTISKARRSTGNPKWRDYYDWHLNGDAAVSITEQLIPYLILKKAQAELGVDFQKRLRIPALKADRTWQQECRSRMAQLNKKGK
jgi:hypothetical protein